jgi:hypothetical protein
MPATPNFNRDPTKPRLTVDDLVEAQRRCQELKAQGRPCPDDPGIQAFGHSVLTVVCRVYFQQPSAAPLAVESSFSRGVEGEEQPWVRRLSVGKDWQPLDAGWLPLASCLLILNEEGRHWAVIPTPEQSQAAAERIVLVAPDDSEVGWKVRPGESMRAEPSDVKKLRLRCLGEGSARVQIIAIPG